MLTYYNYNENPKKRKTGDCSTRALAHCLGISWDEALKLQYEMALKTKYDVTSREVMEKVLAKYGYIKMKQPKRLSGTKYKVKELDAVIDRKTRDKGVVVNVRKHYVCIKGDEYVDIWDSGSHKVGNYYMKVLTN